MNIEIVHGDLLDQNVEVIVNTWNRNIIPWWLLLPQGVSGAIKRRAGYIPFRELGKHGPIPLGGAVLTPAGSLPFKGIIHVAGINMLWRSSERSIRDSVRNAMKLAAKEAFASIAFPIIGAGSGGYDREGATAIMEHEFAKLDYSIQTILVIYSSRTERRSHGKTESQTLARWVGQIGGSLIVANRGVSTPLNAHAVSPGESAVW